MTRLRSIFTLLILCFSHLLYGQVDFSVNVDSSSLSPYYTDYSDHLLLKFGTVIKSNKLQIVQSNYGKTAKFAPTSTSSLGGGVNYKWFGLALSLGLPISTEDIEKYGNTTRLDAQFNIYTKKFGVDVFFQNYTGYHLENPSDFTTWNREDFPKLPTMISAAVGIGGYYFFNHKKFSYKAAYVRNTVQNKSAGSLLLGGYYSLDFAGFEEGSYDRDTIVSFIPKELPREHLDSFDIKAFSSQTYGVSFGYTYTVVFLKKCFVNLSFVPGFGAKNLKVHNSLGENNSKSGVVSRLTIRGAAGFESKHFLMGFTFYMRTADIKFGDYSIKPSTTNTRIFIAKRFNLKKKKK